MAAAPATRISSFHLDAPLERVVPFFTALGERRWVPGWEPEMLSGAEERGSAFRTRAADARETTWIVIDYRPREGRIGYARLAEGSNIGLVDVACTPAPQGGTEVSVRYTLTPLGEEGRVFVEQFLEPKRYARMIEDWRAGVAAALERGSRA